MELCGNFCHGAGRCRSRIHYSEIHCCGFRPLRFPLHFPRTKKDPAHRPDHFLWWRCSRTSFASTSIRRSDAKAPLRSRWTFSPAPNEKRSKSHATVPGAVAAMLLLPIPVAHPRKKTPCPFKGKAFFSGGAGNRTRVLR